MGDTCSCSRMIVGLKKAYNDMSGLAQAMPALMRGQRLGELALARKCDWVQQPPG